MTLFRSYTFSWWEFGIFKVALVSLGISIGIYFESFFSAHQEIIWGIAVIASCWSLIIALRQFK